MDPVTVVDVRAEPVSRRLLTAEIWVVFAVSLGASGVQALLHLIASLTAPKALSHQQALIVGSYAPGRPWIDLAFQVFGVASALAPVALVAYLLLRSGESLATIGVDGREPVRDGVRGAALAAVVGGAGLGFYLAAYYSGANLAVVPARLPDVWWRVPVLLLSAAQNGVLEEVIVAGYLLHRLSQLEWSPGRALTVSAVLRGSYHLYQGFGGFAGNVIMGVIFGRLYQRWGRAAPLIVAHTLIDAVTFVGYTFLHGHVAWLP
ncbi:CPBP family intramembrane metalloprotease [Actinoallomurus spadix]|uniref:Type II CAAX endopeptidase family protein n=1 Tax=Actinoallomurus spadix TaxID=79912 RepID=A0ABP3FH74_9ACTN|nr:CPBP family intramembrane glutamic endopeptidase [Actinoallomurus spadix]MCO5985759.1 CPBP family intramembrane metalloprotease [Actinoallomurus spadix]